MTSDANTHDKPDLAELLARFERRAPVRDEVLRAFELVEGDEEALNALGATAALVRDREMRGRREVEAAFNSVVPCCLDPLCLYCPYWREGVSEPMDADEVVRNVRILHDTTDVRQFHLSGGSMQTGADCGVVGIVRAIRAAGFDDMRVVVNCGASFDDDELGELKRLGVCRVFSTFETCDRELFARVKPGDDLDRKRAFARRIAAAGLGVGTGLMAGLGERPDAWRGYADSLDEISRLDRLEVVYISKFHHAEGIALNDHPACALPEALALVALARLVLRDVHIRAAAGWDAGERERAYAFGAGCIEAGPSFQRRAGNCFACGA